MGRKQNQSKAFENQLRFVLGLRLGLRAEELREFVTGRGEQDAAAPPALRRAA